MRQREANVGEHYLMLQGPGANAAIGYDTGSAFQADPRERQSGEPETCPMRWRDGAECSGESPDMPPRGLEVSSCRDAVISSARTDVGVFAARPRRAVSMRRLPCDLARTATCRRPGKTYRPAVAFARNVMRLRDGNSLLARGRPTNPTRVLPARTIQVLRGRVSL